MSFKNELKPAKDLIAKLKEKKAQKGKFNVACSYMSSSKLDFFFVKSDLPLTAWDRSGGSSAETNCVFHRTQEKQLDRFF